MVIRRAVSIGAQAFDRIEAAGAPRRQIAGEERRDQQRAGRGHVGDRIGRPHVEQQRPQQSRQEKRGGQAADVLKAIVRVRDNKAGVYATVTRRGRVAVGQPVFFEPTRGAK